LVFLGLWYIIAFEILTNYFKILLMKKLTFLFIAIFCGAMFVNAQKVQTISDPNVVPTITQEQIDALGQQYNDGDRGIIYLDFEGLGNLDAINDFYNGGTSQLGFSGPNYGVQFAGALSIIDSDAGGTGNIGNEPSPETVMFSPSENSFVMNVATGFTNGFSFYYAANIGTNSSVEVYDGLNGTGNLIGSVSVPGQNDGTNCTGDPNGYYCQWDVASIPFAGTGMSVKFIGPADNLGFDDVTFGSITPGPQPEIPVSDWAIYFGIFLIGLFVIFRFRRRLA